MTVMTGVNKIFNVHDTFGNSGYIFSYELYAFNFNEEIAEGYSRFQTYNNLSLFFAIEIFVINAN